MPIPFSNYEADYKTSFSYYFLSSPGRVKLTAYDAAGRLVAVVREENVDAGVHAYTWNGRDADGREVTPGVYFLRATQGKLAANVKVVVVR